MPSLPVSVPVEDGTGLLIESLVNTKSVLITGKAPGKVFITASVALKRTLLVGAVVA